MLIWQFLHAAVVFDASLIGKCPSWSLDGSGIHKVQLGHKAGILGDDRCPTNHALDSREDENGPLGRRMGGPAHFHVLPLEGMSHFHHLERQGKIPHYIKQGFPTCVSPSITSEFIMCVEIATE